jgi:hypothetical protein
MRAIGRTDAGTYITKLPKAEHSAPEWQAATGALAGSDARQPDDVGADPCHAGVEPRRVGAGSEPALGQGLVPQTKSR